MSNEESIPSTGTAGDHSGHSIPGIRPPQPLNIDSNVTENWKLFRQKWTNYAIITNLSKHNDQYQVHVTLFLHTLGDEALHVYNGFHFTSSEEHGKLMKYCPSLIVSLVERLTKLMKGLPPSIQHLSLC